MIVVDFILFFFLKKIRPLFRKGGFFFFINHLIRRLIKLIIKLQIKMEDG